MDPISTDRLTLRPFRPDDASDLFDYLHQPTASCFFSLALQDLHEAGREALKRSQGSHYVAITLTGSGTLIGDLFAEAEGDTTSVGWNLNPRFQGSGYAYEAASALFAHLFDKLQVRRIYAYVETTNIGSQKLCSRLGMRQEGLFREFVSFTADAHGAPVYEDTLQYALLAKEWQRDHKADPGPPVTTA